MLVSKSEYSIFRPELVLSDLLDNNFPAWKRETQHESVEWVSKILRQFFSVPKRRGCIINTENQLLHQTEINDSKHASLWSCTVISTDVSTSTTRPNHFADVCVPILHHLAFRGNEEKLSNFLSCLRSEFKQQIANVNISMCWRKSDAVQTIAEFERLRLARYARCSATRVLSNHPVLFGGMVYACAFALAYLRLLWMEKRTQMLVSIGVVPRFK